MAPRSPMHRRDAACSKTRAALAGLALVGLAIFLTPTGPATSPGVSAQASVGAGQRGGIINPADQRQEIISQLKKLNASLAELTAQLKSSEIDVNVVAMPAGIVSSANNKNAGEEAPRQQDGGGEQ